MMMTRFVLTLLIGLVVSLGTSAAFAETFECKRYSDDTLGFTTYSAFESWFPKSISLDIYGWKSRSGYKALTKEENRRKYRLLPNGKMIAGMKPEPGFKTVDNVRYKCDRTSLQLTAGLERKSGDTQTASGPSSATGSTRSLSKTGDDLLYKVSDTWLLFSSCIAGDWMKNPRPEHLNEAKKRGLQCPTVSEAEYIEIVSDGEVCGFYNDLLNTGEISNRLPWVYRETTRRGLRCEVVEKNKGTLVASKKPTLKSNSRERANAIAAQMKYGSKKFKERISLKIVSMDDKQVCAVHEGSMAFFAASLEQKYRGLTCGVGETASNTTTVSSRGSQTPRDKILQTCYLLQTNPYKKREFEKKNRVICDERLRRYDATQKFRKTSFVTRDIERQLSNWKNKGDINEEIRLNADSIISRGFFAEEYVCKNAKRDGKWHPSVGAGAWNVWYLVARYRDLSCQVEGASGTQVASQAASISVASNNDQYYDYYKCVNEKKVKLCSVSDLCSQAATTDYNSDGTKTKKWSSKSWATNYVKEAKKRGVTCGVGEVSHQSYGTDRPTIKQMLSSAICQSATFNHYNSKKWKSGTGQDGVYVKEAKLRGLTCGVVSSNDTLIASNDDERICTNAVSQITGSSPEWFTDELSQKWVKEAKRRGLSCGIGETTQTAAVPKTKPKATSAALTAAEKEAERLRQRVAALEAEKAKQKQTNSSDTKLPTITIASVSTQGKQGIVKGRVNDNTGIAEVTVDGTVVPVTNGGDFEYSTFVPSGGLSLKVQATDLAGLTSMMSVTLERNAGTATAAINFDRLNPTVGKRVKVNKNALALIVGVADYKNTPAKAVFADSDAMMFRDYASEKLGIPESRIKTLVNDGADERELLLSVKSWLARASKQGKSDVYVFFAGHGLASDDGQKMYLLPYDGSPELLEKTAILRQELFDDIASANPRSVTVFLDTCYSGTTRGTDMLIASRPIAIKALEQSIPDNFTVMTAAAGDQTAKPLEEAKHGMFSYFLMKGMEGVADTNQDNKITAGELHQYVQNNVVQQSSGSQTPELQGDENRVLVQFQ